MDILDKIVDYKKKEIKRLKLQYSLSLHNQYHDSGGSKNIFTASMKKSGLSVIAEVKRKSPSAGNLRKNFEPVKMAKEYERYNADAVSVLTDKRFFGGESKHLTSIKNNIRLPVLRKDFIIDPYQLHESKILGADCILLIARILEKKMLGDFITIAKNLGMSSLVEVNSEQEIEKSLNCGAEIIGINNRNLSTFEVDIDRSLHLVEMIPNIIVKISESGIHSASQIKKLYESGFDGVLIGETFMRSEKPGKLIQQWKQQVSCSENDPNLITKNYNL